MTARALIVGLCLLAGQATAEAPVRSPLPPLRPAVLAPVPAVAVVMQAAGGAAPSRSPLPRPRPALLMPAAVAALRTVAANPAGFSAPLVSPVPVTRPEFAPIPVAAALPAPGRRKEDGRGSVCGIAAIKGEEIAPIRASVKGCGLADGVRVTSVSGVRLSTPADIDCATAKALNGWVRDALLPAVGSAGGGVSRLDVAASYVCRPRNNQKGNRISEHGKGHAVDISAIVLESGKAISVQRDWGRGQGGRILKKVRAAACGPFSTVLGPGSDRFHRDHLHVDTARGRGPYCK